MRGLTSERAVGEQQFGDERPWHDGKGQCSHLLQGRDQQEASGRLPEHCLDVRASERLLQVGACTKAASVSECVRARVRGCA